MADVKISQLTEATSISSSDYFVIDNGSETRKVNSSKLAFSFVGMVVQGTNLTTETSVKAIYGSDTSWALISSVALASEHVVGNGKTLGLYDGTENIGLMGHGNYGNFTTNNAGCGTNTGTTTTFKTVSDKSLGVPTKTQLGTNLDNSGIIVDTITVYMWERTS